MLDFHLSEMRRLKLADEDAVTAELLAHSPLDSGLAAEVGRQAAAIVRAARAMRDKRGTLDVFLEEFGLSTSEGIALMCLAEALLRIPDSETADRLIAEKIGSADWDRHLGQAASLFVNASTFGLMLTGRVVRLETGRAEDLSGLLGRLVNRVGEPIIRAAIKAGMRALGAEFVTARSIEEALDQAGRDRIPLQTYSYDMLGEGARSDAQAEAHFTHYRHAIAAVGASAAGMADRRTPSVSVKLSALDPRYQATQRRRVMTHLLPRIRDLCLIAKDAQIGLTIDAEEADRLEISLELLESLALDPALKSWNGLGLAAQAYQKRAVSLIRWIADLAGISGRRIPVRLVKGAYWDGEIKAAQMKGLTDFPVFTRKAATDLSYLAAARAMLDAGPAIEPQFATHNAHTLAAIMGLARGRSDFEFQRLHGMGALMYEAASRHYDRPLPVRVYAPVGSHEDLLPYLVRRLLENGANSSFVAGFLKDEVAIEKIVADPLAQLKASIPRRHPAILPPPRLYGDERRNSRGYDLTDSATVARLHDALFRERLPNAPADTPAAVLDAAFETADGAASAWDAKGGAERAHHLETAADLFEMDHERLFAALVREGGKTWDDAASEIREAVDFLRYYAAQARRQFGAPAPLPGPVGEANSLTLRGRGVFACISPWNFPLAIFTGQLAAALAAGNAVIAKPAEQTPKIAAIAIDLLHQAGIPREILHLATGPGETIGARVTAHPRLAGVAFTGSTETAKAINRQLSKSDGPIIPFIAETGGQNALVVDSTALLEQVVDDAIASAFYSAGQRCSAARVICVQQEVADALITLLKGAMDCLVIGDPVNLATDIGPVIDAQAKRALESYLGDLGSGCRIIHRAALPAHAAQGHFVAPALVEIDALSRLKGEVFGPILHVLCYPATGFDDLIAQIAKTGYGLTFGLHSRLEDRAEQIAARLPVGNIYINRSMIGAVVGTHPFGGQGLSGTGPKAGGPHYLQRFAVERSVTVNTAAQGGNAALLLLQ